MRLPLAEYFAGLRAERRAAFMPFIVAGDPSPAAMPGILTMLRDAGVECLELSVPFSDPIADGVVIEAASQRALRQGGGLALSLRLAERAAAAGMRVVLMGYANPFWQAGLAPLARRMQAAGVQGAIVPDLPVGEARAWSDAFAARGVALSTFAAPTTPVDRLRLADRAARGFIYYASLTGVTGERAALFTGLKERLRAVRRIVRAPVCVGFGISTPGQAAAVARLADGVIVGSAVVRRLAAWGEGPGKRRQIARWVRAMARAVDRG